ncbi:MAG: hypothetical protein SFU56_03750 [Capsulimonadales bacterium]|nr:hypothetical protein [Capsulimonadales bacterium]
MRKSALPMLLFIVIVPFAAILVGCGKDAEPTPTPVTLSDQDKAFRERVMNSRRTKGEKADR